MNTTEGPPRHFKKRLVLWLGSAGAVLATALLPGWASLMWKLGGDFYDDISLRTRVKSISFTIPVSKEFHDSMTDIAEFRSLIIRYGTDEALEDRAMPTERDKVDGQRKLTSKRVWFQAENQRFYLSFELPVHTYLGTQFKLYAIKNPGHDIQEVEKALKAVSDKDRPCPLQSTLLCRSTWTPTNLLGRCALGGVGRSLKEYSSSLTSSVQRSQREGLLLITSSTLGAAEPTSCMKLW